jgi:hypothetical protein
MHALTRLPHPSVKQGWVRLCEVGIAFVRLGWLVLGWVTLGINYVGLGLERFREVELRSVR